MPGVENVDALDACLRGVVMALVPLVIRTLLVDVPANIVGPALDASYCPALGDSCWLLSGLLRPL